MGNYPTDPFAAFETQNTTFPNFIHFADLLISEIVKEPARWTI